jgi:hypothetical protein
LYKEQAEDAVQMLEMIREEAQFIIQDVESDEMPPLTFNDHMALPFFRYPKSNAHAYVLIIVTSEIY